MFSHVAVHRNQVINVGRKMAVCKLTFTPTQSRKIESNNAKAMVEVFKARGFKIVSDGTDNHLFLVDLIDKEYTGKDADAALGRANITVNKNSVPNDPRSPFVTSGLRIGTPALTRRGVKVDDAKALAGWMCDVLDNINDESVIEDLGDGILNFEFRSKMNTLGGGVLAGLNKAIDLIFKI